MNGSMIRGYNLLQTKGSSGSSLGHPFTSGRSGEKICVRKAAYWAFFQVQPLAHGAMARR